MDTKLSDQFFLEEYKIVCNERSYQLKARDYSTAFSIGGGIAILGFLINSRTNAAFLYILPLIIFNLSHIHYVVRSMYALKADSYIQYYFELKQEELNWYSRKTYFPTIKLYKINRWLVSFLFLTIFYGNLYFIFLECKLWYFILSLLMTIGLFGYSFYKYHRENIESFIKRWKYDERSINEKIKRLKKI